MSDRTIKAIIIGEGFMGSQAVKFMVEKGVTLVGGYDINPELQRKDLGEIAGIEPIGVYMSDSLDAALATDPDIAIVCTQTTVADVYPTIKACVEHGVNVGTIAEDCYYPWRTEPELADELDGIAKANGVSILSTGVQDVHWSNVATLMASSVHDLKKISALSYAFNDELGEECLKEVHVGWTKEDHLASVDPSEEIKAMCYTEVLYDVAKSLGLTVINETAKRETCYAKDDLYMELHDLHVKKGCVAGSCEEVILETKEGIILTGKFYAKAHEEGEEATSEWIIEGTPNLRIITDDVHGEITTATIVVTRIPDIINARPGFLTVADMPAPRYYSRPLSEYLR